MEKVTVNKQFSLQWRDFVKSWYVAAGVPLFSLLFKWGYSIAYDIPLDVQWKPIVFDSVVATVVFLGYRFFDIPKVITTYKTNMQALNVANEIKYKIDYSGSGEIHYVVDEKNNLVFTGTLNECDQWIASKK